VRVREREREREPIIEKDEAAGGAKRANQHLVLSFALSPFLGRGAGGGARPRERASECDEAKECV
jgi:hypothetical protein